ncbi:hypothetical protein MM1S1540310_3039 [Mycobacteroides abscessus subsp. bolletii 1S-154-0310]|uniref:hypothetical protein n=1 Tax=Mycobacteroides abscessus TaxID=36809 RepID=UPI00026826FD|nr:hypothetical protein [Mycobacteroides abscessus]WJJ55658.1 hypothetical protein PROPHIT481_37 [Mycobacterium phage prophiT48-1]WJJ55845.1 hypothetical protein PROPHIT361_37 [Mycobacterium phage prophiT36-1]EIU63143.1 hypothetical protein MM1S1510930_3482 [Mycobacteroides abscessus subsp. bolletii 1S-151-0930]EIU70487.1 hypothetical protein MM1S1520914_3688 [Mycobacteroides abscessus subsp. bolletii 1S-152-0914]EIU73722.1 hypothetical protein MM1S1530915_3031 [Mycobacteroides abscessus subsp
MSASEKLQAAINAHTTAQLLSYLAHLETMISVPETRLVGALIADTITEREGIDEALDAVFADEAFTGSYLDAIRIALADRRVKHQRTGVEGMLLNERGRPIAIVHWDSQPLPTWAEWSDLE